MGTSTFSAGWCTVTLQALAHALQRQWPRPLEADFIFPDSGSLATSFCPALGLRAVELQQTLRYSLTGPTGGSVFATGFAFFAQAFLLSSRLRFGLWDVSCVDGLVFPCEFEFGLWVKLWVGCVAHMFFSLL